MKKTFDNIYERTIHCPQCNKEIYFGEPFVLSNDYHYHLECAGNLLEVFSKTIEYHGGSIVAGHIAVEHLGAVDAAGFFCNCVVPHFDLVEKCSECGKPPRH